MGAFPAALTAFRKGRWLEEKADDLRRRPNNEEAGLKPGG
jgi:hypothetical protein